MTTDKLPASPPSLNSPKVMIVAGEASGDLHAAKLVEALRARRPQATFRGIGGAALKAAGVELLFPSSRLAVVGVTEVVQRLPDMLRSWRLACHTIRRWQPDLLILVDFPDFNLRLAPVAGRCGVPVLYYISPQLWAWRAGRVRQIKRWVQHLAVILPFEAAFYQRHKVPVTFVGHPLLDQPLPKLPPTIAVQNNSTDLTVKIVLLPGSRPAEIQRHLPLMLAAAARLTEVMKDLHLQFVIAPAPEADAAHVTAICMPWKTRLDYSIDWRGARPALTDCHLACAVSGTVTLEAALAGVPMVIIYRVSRLSYLLGKALIRVPHIGLINLLAEDTIVPELIQDQVTPDRIAAELEYLLRHPQARRHIQARLQATVARLGSSGAAARTAALACQLLPVPLSC